MQSYYETSAEKEHEHKQKHAIDTTLRQIAKSTFQKSTFIEERLMNQYQGEADTKRLVAQAREGEAEQAQRNAYDQKLTNNAMQFVNKVTSTFNEEDFNEIEQLVELRNKCWD